MSIIKSVYDNEEVIIDEKPSTDDGADDNADGNIADEQPTEQEAVLPTGEETQEDKSIKENEDVPASEPESDIEQ